MSAFWQLCEQRIADEHCNQAGRAAKLATQQADVNSDVRVIRLRRTDKPRSNTTKWQPPLRAQYIKVLDDKQLLGGETVWVLVRCESGHGLADIPQDASAYVAQPATSRPTPRHWPASSHLASSSPIPNRTTAEQVPYQRPIDARHRAARLDLATVRE